MKRQPCFLCGSEAEDWSDEGLVHRVECDVCGRYRVSHHVTVFIGHDPYVDLRRRLSWKVRQTTDAGETVALTRENFEELGRIETLPVSRKLRGLLEEIGKASRFFGEYVSFNEPQLRARLRCTSDDELPQLAAALRQRELIDYGRKGIPGTEDGQGGFGQTRPIYRLTASGWDGIEPTVGAGRPGVCFVAMSFDPQMTDAFTGGIVPAVETDCGLKVLRVDRIEHNEIITDRIIAGIRSAQIVIADFTLQRQGVYFEAGYALGLGRIVIWTCREDDFRNVHFDTRQYNHIVWKDPADLRQRLVDRIRATTAVPVKLG